MVGENMYHALYRKYRPQTFDDVVGQNSIVTTLKNSIINKTFSHAYMFFGPRGTGKTTVSKIFARSINCLSPVDGCACGKCDACLHSFEKECVDIIEIDAASNNGVDEIRELKNKISLVPAELKYKVYIIDEVHMLSIGAFNALLKTLEEPPEHAVFILATTDLQKVPETIISRCQCFSFKRISENSIVERLKNITNKENIAIDDSVLNDIANFSDGGLRDALGLLDKLSSYTNKRVTADSFAELNGTITNTELEKFSNLVFTGDISSILLSIETFNDSGKNLIQVITQLMNYLRNLLFLYYTKGVELIAPIDQVINLTNVINNKLFDIKKTGNPRVYIEMLLIEYVEKNILKSSNKIISREIISNESVEKEETKVLQTNVRYSQDDTVVQETNNDSKKNVLSENVDMHGSSSNECVILNINEIMKARVNNIMAEANKKLLNDVINSIGIFNDYTFDTEIGFVACALLDAKIRAVSNKGIIISYEYDSIVKQNILNLKKITEVYNKLTNSNYSFAIISDSDWNTAKADYIKTIKSGGTYEIMIEPAEEILEVDKKNDIISNSAIELFGDIVEID